MCCDEPPHKRYWRLYYLLDLAPPVTSKQIKWNFRKVTLRHHYYQAYLVLYNRSRKYFYDAIGEDAYGFISSGTWGPLVPLMGAVGTTLLYSIVMLVEIAMLILFFAFLGARVDDVITWDWQSVVAPLMAFVAVALLVTIFALVVSFLSPRTWREDMAWIDRVSPIGNFLAAACYFCLPFVIGHRIREDTHQIEGYCLKYMAIPMIGDILYYLTSLIWRWPGRLRRQMEIDSAETNGFVAWGIFLMGFLNMGCGVAQWVLIGKKVDKTLNRSWYIIFIPFCVRAGLRVFEACLRSLMKYYQGVRSQVGVAFDTVGSFFVNGILLVSLYFVAVRIERGKEKCRMARALIPVYVTLGYMFVAMIITMIYLLVRASDKSTQERRINNLWVPPQDEGPVLGAKGTDGRGAAPPGSTSTSASGPIPGDVRKDRDWEDFDARTTTASSAAFPSDGNAPMEPVDDEEDVFDDFYSDEEEPVFVDGSEGYDRSHHRSPHSSEQYTDGATYYTQDGYHDHDDDPSYDNHSRSDRAPRTEPTPRDSRPSSSARRIDAPLAPAPASARRGDRDRSTLTGHTDEEGDSDYTYEYDEESYTEQSGTHGDDDDDYYYYSGESDEEDMSYTASSSSFSSSFASSNHIDHH